MAVVNEILPFGTGGTVEDGDVMELVAYTDDPHRLDGHQLGIARRELQNTTLRQVSHMTAGLAQFIANRYVPGVVDDGDLAKVEAGLSDAINSMISAALPSATRIETDYLDASAFTPSVDGEAPAGVIEGATNGQKYPCRDFVHAADSSIQISYPMPENWDRGTVKAKLLWSPGAGASAGDDVVFILKGSAVSDGQGLDMAFTTGAGIADQVSADAMLHVSPASAALTIEGTPELGDMIHFQLTRDVSEGTTPMAADCRVIGLLIQYTCNQPAAAW